MATLEAYLSLFGEVPDFPSKLATMRKYNISASIILQDISQIESMYKEDWKTIVANCSSIVFLGSSEPNTLKYFSDMLGKSTVKNSGRGINHGNKSSSSQNINNTARELRFADELGRMNSKKCIVFTQNMRPVEDLKYKYENHPRYKYTADYDNSKGYLYTKISAYDNQSLSQCSNSIIKSKSEATRISKEDYVTDPKSLSSAKTKMTKEEALDDLEFNEKTQERAYLERMIESQLELEKMQDKPFAISVIKGASVQQLTRIARQNFIALNKPIIVFSDISNKDHSITGIAFSPDENFFEALNMELTKKYKKYSDSAMIKINSNRMSDFQDQLLKNYQ